MNNIENAIRVLEEHIASIHTVPELAEKMGYTSSKNFSRLFRNHFGIRPKKVITKIKLRTITDHMLAAPDDIYFCIARRVGLLDDKALYRFIKRHTGKSPGEFKYELISKNEEVKS